MRTTKLRIINDETGEREVCFYENGQICKSFEIDLTKNKIAKQYSGFFLLDEDLKLLLRWTNQFKNNVEDFERKNESNEKNFGVIDKGNEEIRSDIFSLFVSISIIHGRLFSSNKSRGLSLKCKDHVKLQYRRIYDELIKARNDYIAHSSDRMYEMSKVFIIYPITESRFYIVPHSSRIFFFAGKLINEMIEYFQDLSAHVKTKLNELNLKLVEEHNDKKLITLKR